MQADNNDHHFGEARELLTQHNLHDTSNGSPSRVRQPTLLGIPQELRNKIFEYVFRDDVELVRDIVKHELNRQTGLYEDKFADVPRAVRLDQNTAPSKDPIMTCRQLYDEMRKMYTAAYRAYWRKNRFLYSNNELPMPVNKALQHIQYFILDLYEVGNIYVHLHLEDHHWNMFIVPLEEVEIWPEEVEHWEAARAEIKERVEVYVAEHLEAGKQLDFLTGGGFTRDTIELFHNIAADAGSCQLLFETVRLFS